jgi:C-terminal peptidase prc
MLTLLLASVLSLAPVQSGGLDRQLDDVLAAIDAGAGPSWELADRLRDLARSDEMAAVPHLADAAPGRGPQARVVAAQTLADLDAPQQAAELLLPMLDGEQADLALAALANRAFKDVPEVGEALAERLAQPLPGTRRVAVAMALYKASRAPDQRNTAKLALLDAVQSSDSEVRAAGAFALAEVKDIEPAHDVLVSLQNDLGEKGRLARAYLKLEDSMRDLSNRLERQSARLEPEAEPELPGPGAGLGSLDLLEELMRKIQDNHLIGDQLTGAAGREKLIEAAARGMLAALDPHSTFFTSREFERWILDLRRNYAGIGAYVNTIDKLFTITRPIYGGPAYEAGLLSGDNILEVNGWSTIDKQDEDIIGRLKGPPGTEVEVSVHRDGWDEARKFVLKREVIHIPSVNSEMLPGGIGYVELTQFAEDTSDELGKALVEMREQGMQGLIMDLRNNSGGYLEEAVKVSSLFLKPGELVCYTQGRTADRIDYPAGRDPRRWDGPVVVLVNERSASASEIVSGALQDHGRAVLVGERTFGKGSVQQAMALETRQGDPLTRDKNHNGVYDPGEDEFEDRDGNGQYTWPSEVKITNARYYLPSGRSIHTELDIDNQVTKEGGVTPDRVVDMEWMEPWENAELANAFDRLLKARPEGEKFKSPFTRYVEERFDANKKLFYELADDDGRDAQRYPDFEAFKTSLDTHLPDDTLRKLLRVAVRDRVQDDRGRLFVGINFLGDWQEDTQLQEAIRSVAEKASVDISGIQGYRFFAQAPVAPADGQAPTAPADAPR